MIYNLSKFKNKKLNKYYIKYGILAILKNFFRKIVFHKMLFLKFFLKIVFRI